MTGTHTIHTNTTRDMAVNIRTLSNGTGKQSAKCSERVKQHDNPITAT
jgi:hypothetical protein